MNVACHLGWTLGAAVSLAACAPASTATDIRSPSHDYPAPARTTADGEVLGADRKPVTDAVGNSGPPKKSEPAQQVPAR